QALPYDEQIKECPKLALDVRVGADAEETHAMWEDDVVMRVGTEPVDLKPGEKVTHRYLLYQGPVKPSLLGSKRGEYSGVDRDLVDRYAHTLNLNTLTDYPSPGWMGSFSAKIGWSWLVIKCTNIMHWVLDKILFVLPSYGLAIILLTVFVRLIMF